MKRSCLYQTLRMSLGAMLTLFLLALPVLPSNAYAEDVELTLPEAINVAG